jgi:hypothetical protein
MSTILSNLQQDNKTLQGQFDIRDHIDKLQPGKGKDKYICPVCEGRNLSIAPKTGKYKCWSGDCLSADIREAIRPLAEFLAERKGERPPQIARKPKAKKKEYPPAPIPHGAKLLRLPAPGQSPQPEQLKDAPRRVPHNALQTTYEYSATQNVVRYEWPDATNPKGRDKTYSQFHIDPDGKKDWTKGDAPWPAYRIDEIVELLKTVPDGEPILIPMLEGEPNVELARSISVAGLTLQGSNWSDREIQKMLETLRATGKNVIIGVLRDNDDTGIKKGKGVWLVARHIQFPCIVIDPRVIYPDIPEKGDIREILEAIGSEEFLSRLNSEIAAQSKNPEPLSAPEIAPISEPDSDEIKKQFLKELSKKNREEAWALTYPIAWECNQRYLDIPYPDSGLICIKSPKGTGKTTALRQLAAKAQAENRKVLVITHRIVLGRAICSVVGIPWIEEMNSDGDRFIEGKNLGHGLCIDSLHPTSQAAFDPLAWEDALVVFDEVEQCDWHALNSSTCRENRQAILASLRVLLQTVLNSDRGQVVLQDADLSNFSIDFVKQFSGIDVKPWVAVNRYMPDEPWTIKFYDTYHIKGEKQDDPSGLLKDAVARVTLGAKIWLTCDSQKVKSRWGAKNLEKYLRKHCPGKKILRIDSETVSNPEHPAYQCAEKIDVLAALYDIVICTPTLATGVSVDLRGHFSAVFGIFQGAISDNEARQSLARVRESIPRFVWCRQIPVASIGNGSANYREVADSKTKDVRYNLHLLKDFDFDIDSASDPVALRFWAKYAARVNTSAWDFRDSVREGLQAEGHILQSCSDDDAGTTNAIKKLKITSQVEEAVAVANAPDIDEHEREKLENQRAKTDIERYSQEKHDIKEIYKVEEVTPELRQLHQDHWYSKIQLHYLLTHNPDFLWMRDRKHIDGHIRGGEKICAQDIRLLTAKIAVHKLLNTLQFTEPGKEWTNQSPEVLEFVGKVLKYATDVKDSAGIKISPKKAAEDPIGIVNIFVKQFGLRLKGEQRRKGNERQRVYSFGGFASVNVYDQNDRKVPEPETLRSQIFEAWVKRDELALFEFLQKPVLIPEPAVTPHEESALNLGSSDLEQKNESVTPETINKVKISAVTTNSTAEPHIEPCPVSKKAWGWFQRKLGEWIKCRVLEFVDGRYLLEAKSMVDDGVARFRAYPEDLRWEAPIC